MRNQQISRIIGAVASLKAKAAVIVLLAFVIVPAPLLPSTGLAESVQSVLGVGWKAAYLATAVGLHSMFYGSLGVVAAFAVDPEKTRGQYWLQLVLVPVVTVGIAMLVRSLKLGHAPVAANAVVPVAACSFGVITGLFFRRHGWRVTVTAMVIVMAGFLWAYWPGVSSRLSRDTETQLRRLVAGAGKIPAGEGRFGALLQAVFAPMPSTATRAEAVEQNRAAILALGIAIGDEHLARFAGLDRGNELVRAAAALRPGTTLRGREDWARHYCVSATLTVLETPFISDSGGLIKEQLDALTGGSGFSFGDLAADRAGVRFALAATDSEAAASKMQKNLQGGYSVDDYFPAVADLPENLTVEQFRQKYVGVGAQPYRQVINEIDARLNRCAALSPP